MKRASLYSLRHLDQALYSHFIIVFQQRKIGSVLLPSTISCEDPEDGIVQYVLTIIALLLLWFGTEKNLVVLSMTKKEELTYGFIVRFDVELDVDHLIGSAIEVNFYFVLTDINCRESIGRNRRPLVHFSH